MAKLLLIVAFFQFLLWIAAETTQNRNEDTFFQKGQVRTYFYFLFFFFIHPYF